MLITTRVDKLPEWAVAEALSGGMSKAIDLIEAEVLIGSIVFVGGQVGIWPKGLIRPIAADSIQKE
jgi:hypothetical protein